MRRYRFKLFGLLFLGIIGCVGQAPEQPTASSSLPVVRGSQLADFLEQSQVPVLVEFGVDFQCERCRTMQQGVAELGEKFEGHANVVRVDFNANAGLVSQFGGTICPAYVFFQDGKPLRTLNFPVSTDMLESELIAMTGFSGEQSP